MVKLRYFAGLGVEETAGALEISARTVKRDWAFARAWLLSELDVGANQREEQGMSEVTMDRIRQVFAEVVEATGSDRERRLAQLCGDDRALRAHVVRLLAAHDRTGDVLASPSIEGASAAAAALLDRLDEPTDAARPAGYVGTMVGPYKILQVIGEGGFGTVYMAEQQEPIRRRVALKLIKLGMDTRQVVARFEAERQALAMMEHPNIARVLDAGATASGRPYFVMELVKGVPITDYCDEHCLGTRERLELFKDVCAAVQHAHQKGVVHRDLKPSNVLIAQRDGRAVPKVIDFGVARATGQQLTDKTLFTAFGQFIGTPLYMSPEQAETSGADVDTRSDIYSLGVLLYELLTGTTPFTSGQIRNVAHAEVLRVLRQVDPPPPSTRVSQLGETGEATARLRGSEPNRLQKLLRGDLDWIVMKALEKDRSRRYASASELAVDLERYFVGDPVSAGPPELGYRLRKIVRRNRGKATAAAAVVAALVLGGGAATWQAARAGAAAERARATAVVASATAAQDPVLKALLIEEVADVPGLPGRLAVLRDVANDPLPTAVVRPPDRVARWDYSPDGRYVAASFRDGTARVWRTDGAASDVPLILRHPAAVHGITFSPDSRRIATGTAEDGTVRIWAVDGTGIPVELPGHEPRGLWRLSFSPDGRRIAAESAGVIRVWAADGDGDPSVLRVEGVELSVPEWSPEGDRIMLEGSDGIVRIWPARSGEPVAIPADGWIQFTPDGERIVARGSDGTIRVAPADGSQPPAVLEPSDEGMESFTLSPDGRHMVLGYLDGTVRLVPFDGIAQPEAFRTGAAVYHATVTPDGSRVLASSWDGRLRAFRIGRPMPLPHLDATQPLAGTSFAGPPGLPAWVTSRDGSRVAVGFVDGSIRTFRLDHTGEARIAFGGDAGVADARFSPDGRRIATGSEDGTVRILSVDGPVPPNVLGAHEGAVRRVAFSPDGSRLVTSSSDGTARIWRVDGAEAPIVLRHEGPVDAAVFGPDGVRVATAARDGRVRAWDLDDPSRPALVHPARGGVRGLRFSPDGSRLAIGSSAGSSIIRVDGTGEPAVLSSITGPDRGFEDVVFGPDSSLLAASSENEVLRVRSTGGRRRVEELHGHTGDITRTVFSPDGSRIATAADDGTARVWRVDGSDEPLVLRGHGSAVRAVDFSPDGKRVVTASLDGTVRVWQVTWDDLLEYVRSNLHACLTPEQRMNYLAESESAARTESAACERRLSHG